MRKVEFSSTEGSEIDITTGESDDSSQPERNTTSKIRR